MMAIITGITTMTAVATSTGATDRGSGHLAEGAPEAA